MPSPRVWPASRPMARPRAIRTRSPSSALRTPRRSQAPRARKARQHRVIGLARSRPGLSNEKPSAVSVLHPRSCVFIASEGAETPHDGSVGTERGRAFEHHSRGPQATGPGSTGATGGAAQDRLAASSDYLCDVLGQVPVLVIGAITVGAAGLPEGNQAGVWGSLLPAAWSLALALRARGLGTAWTTLHLTYEREVAQVLGLPADVRQGVLLPVAYTKGTDFRAGPRADLDAALHVNGW
jgi:nitroreductase